MNQVEAKAQKSSSIDQSDVITISQKLLKSANKVVDRVGMDSLSIDLVATEAGVSRSSAYRQIGTMNNLIIALLADRGGRYGMKIRAIVDKEATVSAALCAAYLYNNENIAKDPVIHRVLMQSDRLQLFNHPSLARGAFDVLGDLFQKGQQRGEVRRDLPIDVMIQWVIEQQMLILFYSNTSSEWIKQRVAKMIMPALQPDDRNISYQSELEANYKKVLDAMKLLNANVEHFEQILKKHNDPGDSPIP